MFTSLYSSVSVGQGGIYEYRSKFLVINYVCPSIVLLGSLYRNILSTLCLYLGMKKGKRKGRDTRAPVQNLTKNQTQILIWKLHLQVQGLFKVFFVLFCYEKDSICLSLGTNKGNNKEKAKQTSKHSYILSNNHNFAILKYFLKVRNLCYVYVVSYAKISIEVLIF